MGLRPGAGARSAGGYVCLEQGCERGGRGEARSCFLELQRGRWGGAVCGDMGGGGEGLLCFELAGAEHAAFAGALGAEFRPLPARDGLRWSKSLKD